MVDATDRGENSSRDIARRFGVGLSFVVRTIQRRRSSGGLDPKPHDGGACLELSVGDRIRLLSLSRRHSDATLQQLKGRWSKLKARLRRAAARTTPALNQAMAEALDHLATHDICGWFQHSRRYATRAVVNRCNMASGVLEGGRPRRLPKNTTDFAEARDALEQA